MATSSLSLRVFVLFCAIQSGAALADHFYTLDRNGEGAPYRAEGFEGYVSPGPRDGLVPIYRYSDDKRELHFYTANQNEGNIAESNGYRSEGTPFYCSPIPLKNTTPLHRWYSKTDESHFYTTNGSGELAPSLNYVYEGVLCHVFSSRDGAVQPLYRFYRGNKKLGPVIKQCGFGKHLKNPNQIQFGPPKEEDFAYYNNC